MLHTVLPCHARLALPMSPRNPGTSANSEMQLPLLPADTGHWEICVTGFFHFRAPDAARRCGFAGERKDGCSGPGAKRAWEGEGISGLRAKFHCIQRCFSGEEHEGSGTVCLDRGVGLGYGGLVHDRWAWPDKVWAGWLAGWLGNAGERHDRVLQYSTYDVESLQLPGPRGFLLQVQYRYLYLALPCAPSLRSSSRADDVVECSGGCMLASDWITLVTLGFDRQAHLGSSFSVRSSLPPSLRRSSIHPPSVSTVHTSLKCMVCTVLCTVRCCGSTKGAGGSEPNAQPGLACHAEPRSCQRVHHSTAAALPTTHHPSIMVQLA
nr:hypothetical protein CFP56_16872 [Quercus suber]